MHYSIQPRDFVKRCGFPPFAKNMGTNIGKNISKNLSGKYSQNVFIMINRQNVFIMITNLKQMHLKFFQKSNSKNSRRNW